MLTLIYPAMNLAWLVLFVGFADAHITLSIPPLSCDPILPAPLACMRGQVCSRHGMCETVPKSTTGSQENHDGHSSLTIPAAKALGQTGPENDPMPAVAHGGEPSSESSGPSSIPGVPNIAEAPIGMGASSIDEISPPSGGNMTTNGSCGAKYENTVCGDWYKGGCCSPYGWCGNTTSHCGFGCQSGPCVEDSIVRPIGPMTYVPRRKAGKFGVVGRSGVPAMTAVLLRNGRVLFVDKVENYTELVLENGRFAYSAEYDPITNEVVGLSIETNPFCCGGTFLADGRVISVGGNGPLEHVDPTVGNGFQGIRYLERELEGSSNDGDSWYEPGYLLSSPRWYPTVQILPDGRLFVVSGSVNGLDPTDESNNNPTYEVLDENGYPNGYSIPMSILERNQPYYMYPFLHLLRDGRIFVFVSKSAEIFDVDAGETVRMLPDLRGDYRTYPNTGGSVLLPLTSRNSWEPEVMVCGGGAYQDKASPTDPSCGRIRPLSDNPDWELDAMPKGRGMVEGILLPDGTVLWINGSNRGAQGYSLATDPVYDAWIYSPDKRLGKRWKTAGTSSIARLYHSTALLLLDGTVMVAGSNPLEQPVLVPNPANPAHEYVTEFRVEIYTPHYLLGNKATRRPQNVYISDKYLPAGSGFSLSFTLPRRGRKLRVALYHGGFVTHSLHMNHRMLFLDTEGWRPWRHEQYLWVTMPPNSNVCPPGPYVVYVVVDGIPSVGQFVMVE